MIQIRRSAIVRQTPEQMFDLVNDVESYPRRFAWCDDAKVIASDDASITAHLDVRLGALTQGFTTRNTLDRPTRISLELVEGPFSALGGVWTFIRLGGDGCKIALSLDFDYSGLMAPLLRSGFQKLADRMVDEFCSEAERIYA
jgi:ribosome-associated toxin RatA of RatAB toxin-antitoxin module